ncbi:hypothetical protein SEA_CLARKSON_56 [Mycobacterium phage Clarkson]|nr:hypothetical protein SEA_CLARKSON_56 [Mycobacterium phage Clarkson]
MTTPSGFPMGRVTALRGAFDRPPGKAAVVEVKQAVTPNTEEPKWSWWVTVDRHPYSDKRGYDTPEEARAKAVEWAQATYPNRPIQHIEDVL